jgi:chemotaxis protein methyltransferase CheR
VFEALESEVLPELVSAASNRTDSHLRVWSCGCASGEEPYSILILWQFRLASLFPGIEVEMVATDCDSRMVERARRGLYESSSFRELPADLVRESFRPCGGEFEIRCGFRQKVNWVCQDVRTDMPPGTFDLILCRNLVFTYYQDTLQWEVMERILNSLHPGGALVIGTNEHLPEAAIGLVQPTPKLPIFKRKG